VTDDPRLHGVDLSSARLPADRAGERRARHLRRARRHQPGAVPGLPAPRREGNRSASDRLQRGFPPAL